MEQDKKIVSKFDWIIFILGFFIIFIDLGLISTGSGLESYKNIGWDYYMWFFIGLLLFCFETTKIIKEFKLVENKKEFIWGITIFSLLMLGWVYSSYVIGVISIIPVIILVRGVLHKQEG